jgi:Uma2 family endonuclease
MIQLVSEPVSTKVNHLSVQEFYDSIGDRPEIRYELEDGKIIVMPPEPISNSVVSRRLFMALAKYVPLYSLTYKEVFVEVSGRRVRNPDLLILGEECFNALEPTTQVTITQDMPPPLVAIEIVSSGNENIARDYRYKRSEYAARGISEYWIVDPQQRNIIILTLVEGFYEEVIYTGAEQISTQVFPEIEIKVNEIL